MLDLNALHSFLIAAETLNFSRAAERRNTVQSAISAHITKLENELGRTLFERGRGQAMRLTAEGQALAVYARRILGLADEAVETIRNARSLRSIRLGTTVTLAQSVVVEALRLFARDHGDVQIHIECERSDALLAQLDADQIDVAFMMDQGKRPGRDFVENMPLVWAAGPRFALAPSDDVPLVFLTDGRDLRGYAFDALDRTGRVGYLAHSSPHPIGVRSFVLADLALTVMPKASVTPPLVTLGSEHDLPPLKSVALSLYRKAGFADEALDAFSVLIQKQVVGDAG
ncbi:MAG: LysR substrate-binding domain-containing protein [Hyphomicrobiales bacterium]